MINDRFKFRAWHKPTKRLFKVWSFSPEYVFDNSMVRIEECVLEQSTGLKDKNSRLIYEGDIVKFAINDPEEDYFYGVVRYSIENWKYEIVVRNETFCLCQVRGMDIEVIGNIHENKTLLEVE